MSDLADVPALIERMTAALDAGAWKPMWKETAVAELFLKGTPRPGDTAGRYMFRAVFGHEEPPHPRGERWWYSRALLALNAAEGARNAARFNSGSANAHPITWPLWAIYHGAQHLIEIARTEPWTRMRGETYVPAWEAFERDHITPAVRQLITAVEDRIAIVIPLAQRVADSPGPLGAPKPAELAHLAELMQVPEGPDHLEQQAAWTKALVIPLEEA